MPVMSTCVTMRHRHSITQGGQHYNCWCQAIMHWHRLEIIKRECGMPKHHWGLFYFKIWNIIYLLWYCQSWYKVNYNCIKCAWLGESRMSVCKFAMNWCRILGRVSMKLLQALSFAARCVIICHKVVCILSNSIVSKNIGHICWNHCQAHVDKCDVSWAGLDPLKSVFQLNRIP